MKILLSVFLTILLFFPRFTYGQDIVPHPDMLTFPDLTFDPPPPDAFRTTLQNGIVVYIGEDRELPLVNVTVLIRGGAAWEDAGKTGLASLTGAMMRDGGTILLTPAELDEEIDFLAANISISFGNTYGSAHLNILSKDLQRGLELLVDILRIPAFDEERFRLQRDRIRQNLARRNDQTAQIESREWGYLLYGEDHFSTRDITVQTLAAITPDDLRAYHEKFVHPGNMMVVVSGDFDKEDMIGKLENVFLDWPVREAWDEAVPHPQHTPAPGIYMIDKPDVNQGRISIGHQSTTMDNPDRFALQVMNGILGASQFTSRIMSRVRSDEGLAYTAGSALSFGMHYPGTFRAYFQSRSETCAYATHIIIEEIMRIRDELVTEEELAVQINSMLEAFPRNFASISQTVLLYARDEFEGRDPERWLTYRDSIRVVNAEDVQRVARQYLLPDQLIILVVGNTEDILKGDHRYEFSFDRMEGYTLHRLPLRDPLTLSFAVE
jgi:zinc protease